MDIITTPFSSALILPTRLDHLHPLLAYTQKLAEIIGFSSKEQHQLQLAVEEIFTNIIQHGFENNSQETFQVNFDITSNKIVVKFLEKGLPFDPAALPHYSPDQATDNPKGLGIYLARKFVDDITFRYLGRHGKETILTKYLRQQQTLIQNVVAEEPVSKAVNNVKYQIRRFQPEDAIPVARCAYRAYGYSYADDHVYDPAQLIKQNKTGSLISLVAKAEDGEEILGYVDLRPYGEIADIESMFIAPEYRGTRLFQRLSLAIVEESRRLDLFGHFCLSVTSHTITQKGARFIGLVDCGILLGFIPETDFKSMSIQTHHRVSLVIQFGVLKDRMPATIYPPANHRMMITKIYTTLKVPFVIDDCAKNAPALQESTVYNLELQSDMNYAILRLSSYGSDAITIIKEQTTQCCRQMIDVIYLYLDLQNPVVSSLTEEAEKIGFFFAGVLPAGLENHDALILQYLNVPLDWDEIKLATPFANELLAYVHQEYDRTGH